MEDIKQETELPVEKSVLEQARESVKRLEEANKKTEELLDRQEQLAAKELLGGRAEGGIAPIPKKELTSEEYAQQVLAGKINPLRDGI